MASSATLVSMEPPSDGRMVRSNAEKWQECAAVRTFCHWWQFFAIPRVSDMSTLAVIIGIAIVVIVVAATVSTVRAILRDGYRQLPTCPDAPRVGLQ